MSKVDLPEPDGPTRPTASPLPILQIDVFEDMDAGGAAPEREVDTVKASSPAVAVAGPSRRAESFRGSLVATASRAPPSYGTGRGASSALARCWSAIAWCGSAASAAELRLAAETPVQIVALGDSLAAGFGLPAAEAFPAKLGARTQGQGRWRSTITNAGVSGDTASGGLARLDWSVPEGTDAVILELGANDMLRGLDPGVTRLRRHIPQKLAAASHPRSARRHAVAAQPGQGLRRNFKLSFRRLPR